ncbi:MAG: transport-associated protein [Geobacteraceae bacterium GWC2_58_44]|nr:MAG: transport-associated protein [Geobacteraceae bacterium GWC2_58_44]HBG04102.1 transport-associated protein [Geobacter sp.]
MKPIHSLSIMAAVVALLAVSAPAVHASKTDSRIEGAAKQSHVFKTYLKGDDIKVKSKDGAVTLTGEVLDESHLRLAQETVAGLPNVKSVDNRLKVKAETPSKTPDAWTLAKVKSTLLFHRSVSAATTEVDVKDGMVTLRGSAANQAQKDLTSEYVRDVEGVKEVKNEMTVSQSPKKTKTVGKKIDDASITAQVKMTLLYHRSTSALKTKIETDHGVVSMYGKAKDTAEKELAAKLAGDVNGVKGVNNRMTVE